MPPSSRASRRWRGRLRSWCTDSVRLPDARPVGHDALGRRGAAIKSRRAVSKLQRAEAHRLHPRRTDDGPAPARRRGAARLAESASWMPATPSTPSSTTTRKFQTADHVIDLGPEGGHAGGQVVVTGTPGGRGALQGVAHGTVSQAASEGVNRFADERVSTQSGSRSWRRPDPEVRPFLRLSRLTGRHAPSVSTDAGRTVAVSKSSARGGAMTETILSTRDVDVCADSRGGSRPDAGGRRRGAGSASRHPPGELQSATRVFGVCRRKGRNRG